MTFSGPTPTASLPHTIFGPEQREPVCLNTGSLSKHRGRSAFATTQKFSPKSSSRQLRLRCGRGLLVPVNASFDARHLKSPSAVDGPLAAAQE
jgi:hypothetical protein